VSHRVAASLPIALALAGCGGQLDAGSDVPHGPLPVDERSAVVVVNDGALDNWQGEYAALLAASGRLRFVGLVVNSTTEYPSVETNVTGFREMISAGRDSGMRHLPDPTASIAPALTEPASGSIEDTVPNRSEGARFILQAAAAYGSAVHPLAIATGGALTDVADAYLMDPSLAERAVVVSSLGQTDGDGASTFNPNGGHDTWATFIVTSRLRLVQVNGYYDQLLDVPDAQAKDLPKNAFGRWMATKRSELLDLVLACDQITVMAVAMPWFSADVTRLRVDDTDPTQLVPDAAGQIWHVAQSDSVRARSDIWTILKDPSTFQ
jgi:hypothetical protein